MMEALMPSKLEKTAADLRTALEDLVDAMPNDMWMKLPKEVRYQAMSALYPQKSPLEGFVEGYMEALQIKHGEVL